MSDGQDDEPLGIETLTTNELVPTSNGHNAAHPDGRGEEATDACDPTDVGKTRSVGELNLDAEEREAYAQLKRLRAERRKKRLIRRGIVAGVLVVAVAGVFAWRAASAQQAAQQAVQVVTQPVMRGPFTEEVTGSGSIKPASSTVVSPEVDGTIESVNVVTGQQVAAGDVLFTIKNDNLDRAVAEAERNVRAAQSAVDEAKRGAAQAGQQLESARSNSASASKAVKAAQSSGGGTSTSSPTASPEAVAAARAAAEQARAQAIADAQAQQQAATDAVSGAEQGVASANAQIESAQLQLESANDALAQAQAQADKRTVRAPIAGNVIELSAQPGIDVGQAATAAQASGSTGALCQIADLSQMTVTTQVGEADINKVAVGQPATATFTAVSDVELAATVRSIASTSTGGSAGPYGDKGGSGVTYAVEVVIPQPDERLKPGMTANVSITTLSLDSALIVPTVGLANHGDGTGTLTVEDDAETHEAHTVSVKILASSGSEAAVEPLEDGGLAEGDAVIISGDAGAVASDGTGSSGGSSSSSWAEYDENGNVVAGGGSATEG